jgi:hypothetical protein
VVGRLVEGDGLVGGRIRVLDYGEGWEDAADGVAELSGQLASVFLSVCSVAFREAYEEEDGEEDDQVPERDEAGPRGELEVRRLLDEAPRDGMAGGGDVLQHGDVSQRKMEVLRMSENEHPEN